MASGSRDWHQRIEEIVIAHKTDHQKNGLDELSINELSGKAADDQKADIIKAGENALRPAATVAGQIYYSTDIRKLSITKESSPASWDEYTEVDKTDTNADKNKWVSNALAKGWEDHKDSAALHMQTGMIVIWSGLLVNIPSGWSLCDGGGSRPDLRNKFIKGAADGVDPGATGGNSSHSHTVDSHTHSIGSHTHGAGNYQADIGLSTSGFATNGQDAIDSMNDPANIIGTSGAGSGNTGGATPGTDAQTHEPPFFVIAYIYKD